MRLGITSRLRPMIPEMTLPLRRSAKKMFLGRSRSDQPYIFLDEKIARSLVEKSSEVDIVTITGRVKSYDRDAGIGKFVSDALPRVLNFIIPINDRARLRDLVLEAMRRNRVAISCRRTIDQSGLPTSLTLIDVFLDHDEPEPSRPRATPTARRHGAPRRARRR
jgi:hypothetical protein